MGRAFTPGLRANEHTVISRLRELPAEGEIFAKVGDAISPDQVIGRALLEGDLMILRIPEQMGVDPETVVSALREGGVKEGDSVSVGQRLCSVRGLFGLFRNEFKSTAEGTIELISERTGHVAVRLAPRAVEVQAYLGGTVENVVPSRSVTIKGDATFVQGVFGVGGERYGVVKRLAATARQEITPDLLPQNCAGLILVGGTAPSGDALREAAARGATGMIVGAIDDKALTEYLGYDIGIALTGDEDISMSVIITEGFGKLAMSERVYKLLCSLEGRPCSMNGATQVRAGAVRPELVSSRGAGEKGSGALESISDQLQVGTKVRLIRVPFFGDLGVVVDLPHEPVVLDTGSPARVLRAKLSDGREVAVPRANVEIVS